MELKVVGKNNNESVGAMCWKINQTKSDGLYNRMIRQWTCCAIEDMPKDTPKIRYALNLVSRLEQFYEWILVGGNSSLWYALHVIKIDVEGDLPEYLADCIYFITKNGWPDEFCKWNKDRERHKSHVIDLFEQFKTNPEPLLERKIGADIHVTAPARGKPYVTATGRVVNF